MASLHRKEPNLNIRGFISSLDIGLTNSMFALGAAVLSFLLIHGLLALFRKRIGELSEERAHRPVAEVLRQTLARTSTLAVVATSALIGLSVLELPQPWDGRVRHLWFLTLGIQFALYAHRAIKVGSRRYFRSRANGLVDEQVSVANTLVIWVLQTSVWIVFALAMLANLGINVSTFVASLGIGGVAIALAVQNILGDLFASLSIATDKPFEVGDAIAVAGFSGTVEHVGLKTTRVRADSGEQIVIANSELLKNTVRNYKRMSNRRVPFTLRINPSTRPALAVQVPALLRAIIEKHDKVRFDRAHLKTLDPQFLEFEVIYFVLDPSYGLFMDIQQAVLLEAMEALERLGISTAVPPHQMLVQPGAQDDQRVQADKGIPVEQEAGLIAPPVRTLYKGA
jgi:small-conductance mechanosensitive channel